VTAELQQTPRTTVRRKADRGRYDRDTIDAILDEALVAHVGFALDGQPWVIPMTFARIDDMLYLHGASANHLLSSLAGGIPVCATVTLLDGLVLSRSAFHHSMNYRSVVVVGVATKVEDTDEKHRALRAVVDHMVANRSDETRGPSDKELRATLVVRLPIHEASAKVRTGPPIEEPDDLALPYWGGVIPVHLTRGAPVPDDDATP
jgi:nitroimidazol reductase NimA-like FMN-containing flavoprotein (pyridoxamine 5'-phosphate oxidase superfamily)